MTPITDLDRFVTTRVALHQVAEHVVAKARYVDDGGIRLVAFAGGFGTPPLSDGRRVWVVGDQLHLDGAATPLTSVADAARFVGVEPGLPGELYATATRCEPDRSLDIDRSAATALGQWFAFATSVLETFAAEVASPSLLVLWPEHFDLAFFTEDAEEAHRANYGASPGDAAHGEPYLYVGPLHEVVESEYWNAAHFNGALLSHSDLLSTEDPFEHALQFMRAGRALLIAD